MYRRVVWGCIAMALIAAITYVLLGVGVIHAGDLSGKDMPSFFYVIPAAYVIMGVLILSRWRWIRIASAAVVALTILVFYVRYAGQPDVMWSAPGLITKIAQIFLLAGLIYLLAKTRPEKNTNVK
jgi:hypothetical protein